MSVILRKPLVFQRRGLRVLWPGLEAAVAVCLTAVVPCVAAAQSFTEYVVPTAFAKPYGISAGPDGNLWFTEASGNKIGRITTSGVITEFELPAASFPSGIALGPDGHLWFAESGGDKIGRITTSGVITEFAGLSAAGAPRGIAAGPDGNLWFAEYGNNKVGRITTSGDITEFETPTAISRPSSIAAGPDGNLWFVEGFGNKVGRITTSGVITEFAVPTANADPLFITAGPDGNLWFTEYYGNKIGRITTSGFITEFELPTAECEGRPLDQIGRSPGGIAAGSDGNLWFTEYYCHKIGRITTSGVITEFDIPAGYGAPLFIAAGPDRAIWFTMEPSSIGRLTTSSERLPIVALRRNVRTRILTRRP